MTGPGKHDELRKLRFRVAELEQAEAECKRAEAAEREQRALADALCEIADAVNIMLIESGIARVVRCQDTPNVNWKGHYYPEDSVPVSIREEVERGAIIARNDYVPENKGVGDQWNEHVWKGQRPHPGC